MTFLYPLGLLGLIGIPVIIIIYILRNRFIEQIIPTTYIWTLSERFLKRRNPLSKLAGIISLILQLLLVAAISFAIAHPVLILGGEARNYTFVLDGSGSMNTVEDGTSRFDEGKAEIEKLINEAVDGSRYSLIYVGGETTIVFEDIDDKERAVLMLSDLAPSSTSIAYTDAIGVAQGYFNNDNSTVTYLVTDKNYASATNVEVINVASDVVNVGLSDVKVLGSDALTVWGNLVSYTDDRTVTVAAYADGMTTPAATLEVSLVKGQVTQFSMPLNVIDYYSMTVKVLEDDALTEDSELVVYSVDAANEFTALVVSEQPFFIASALSATSAIKITKIKPSEYEGQRGYNLYVFDSYTPFELPKDGAVWYINPQISVNGTGFSVQGKFTPAEGEAKIEASTSTNSQVEKLLTGMTGADIYVQEYISCGIYDSSFITLLSHKGNPLLFTGANTHGNREVVFAFDLHESNLVGQAVDFIALVDNLIDFSFPTVLEKTDYVCGETASINIVAGTDSIVATAPSGEVISMSTSGTAAELKLTEAGIYKIECMTAGNAKEYYIFSEFPMDERAPVQTADSIALLGEAGDTGIDGKYDNILIIFILIALIFTSEWVVYCYEKYQLR